MNWWLILRAFGATVFLVGALGSVFGAPCPVVAGAALLGGGLYMIGVNVPPWRGEGC